MCGCVGVLLCWCAGVLVCWCVGVWVSASQLMSQCVTTPYANYPPRNGIQPTYAPNSY